MDAMSTVCAGQRQGCVVRASLRTQCGAVSSASPARMESIGSACAALVTSQCKQLPSMYPVTSADLISAEHWGYPRRVAPESAGNFTRRRPNDLIEVHDTLGQASQTYGAGHRPVIAAENR
jgi:hypothetical protein